MKKEFLVVVILLLLIVSLLIFLMVNGYLNKSHESRSKPENIYKENYIFLKDNLWAFMENELYHVNNVKINSGNDTSNTFQLFKNEGYPYLIFRFSGNDCEGCISMAISKLQHVFTDYSLNEHLILLGSEINPRVKEKYYKKNVFSYCNETMGIPLEQQSFSFFMIVEKDLEAKMIFIPNVSYPEITEEYLNTIKKRFFD